MYWPTFAKNNVLACKQQGADIYVDGNERYFEGNVTYPLPANFGVTGHIGYTNGNGFHEAYGQSSYMDWSVGVTYTWSHFDMALKWVDGSDLETVENGVPNSNGKQTDVFSSEARAIFSISTTYPWRSHTSTSVGKRFQGRVYE